MCVVVIVTLVLVVLKKIKEETVNYKLIANHRRKILALVLLVVKMT